MCISLTGNCVAEFPICCAKPFSVQTCVYTGMRCPLFAAVTSLVCCLQARKMDDSVIHSTAAQPPGAISPPTAVLGFSPLPCVNNKPALFQALPKDDSWQHASSSSLDAGAKHAQQQGQNPGQFHGATESKAKDYGAPWTAAAASAEEQPLASPAHTDAARQSTQQAVSTPAQPDEAPDPQDQPANAFTAAPSPFTVPSAKAPGLFQSMSNQPAAFRGFGPDTSKAPDAATQPSTTPGPVAPSTASQPAVLPLFPSAVFQTHEQNAEPSSKPTFTFGASPAPAQDPKELPKATQAARPQAAGKPAQDKPSSAAERSRREASVASDVSGGTAVDEQLYSFTSQRSPQDRLEGLVNVFHQAADDVEGLYTFGQTARTLADKNKPGSAAKIAEHEEAGPARLRADQHNSQAASNHGLPVTPLQVWLCHCF